jgi:uncharacterized protein YndB with AHSA1/START domain
MTVTDIRKDPKARTMTLDAEFQATPERVWQLWADPRQLERWWGPPPTRQQSILMTCVPAVRSSTT